MTTEQPYPEEFKIEAVKQITQRGHRVPTYLYKLVYDATADRAWAHWQANQEGERVSRPISYAELVRRTGIEFLPGRAQ